MLKDATITVFNRHTDLKANIVTYHKTVLSGHWESVSGKGNSTAAGTDQHSSNSANAFIPFSVQEEISRKYISREEYQELNEYELCNYFTFAPEDIIYKGEIKDEVSDDSLKKFLKEHPGYYVIQSATSNDFGTYAMKHWEVHCSE